MKIEIRLYGEMKQYAPGENNQFELNIEPGALFLDIIHRLDLPDAGYVSLVNGRRVTPSYCFRDKDTLVLFPELCGG